MALRTARILYGVWIMIRYDRRIMHRTGGWSLRNPMWWTRPTSRSIYNSIFFSTINSKCFDYFLTKSKFNVSYNYRTTYGWRHNQQTIILRMGTNSIASIIRSDLYDDKCNSISSRSRSYTVTPSIKFALLFFSLILSLHGSSSHPSRRILLRVTHPKFLHSQIRLHKNPFLQRPRFSNFGLIITPLLELYAIHARNSSLQWRLYGSPEHYPGISWRAWSRDQFNNPSFPVSSLHLLRAQSRCVIMIKVGY